MGYFNSQDYPASSIWEITMHDIVWIWIIWCNQFQFLHHLSFQKLTYLLALLSLNLKTETKTNVFMLFNTNSRLKKTVKFPMPRLILNKTGQSNLIRFSFRFVPMAAELPLPYGVVRKNSFLFSINRELRNQDNP